MIQDILYDYRMTIRRFHRVTGFPSLVVDDLHPRQVSSQATATTAYEAFVYCPAAGKNHGMFGYSTKGSGRIPTTEALYGIAGGV